MKEAAEEEEAEEEQAEEEGAVKVNDIDNRKKERGAMLAAVEKMVLC